MQNTVILKELYFLKIFILKFYGIRRRRNSHMEELCEGQIEGIATNNICLTLLNILGSHEVTSFIFQMQQQKHSSPCPPAPTSGSYTLVGKFFW